MRIKISMDKDKMEWKLQNVKLSNSRKHAYTYGPFVMHINKRFPPKWSGTISIQHQYKGKNMKSFSVISLTNEEFKATKENVEDYFWRNVFHTQYENIRRKMVMNIFAHMQ